MIAVLPGSGRAPKAAQPQGVPVPQHSGFIASLVAGDYVFVAGQMPNNEEMTGIAEPAYRAPNAVWNGTDIRLQTEFLITSRLRPALEAGGSSLQERDQGAGLSHQHRGSAGVPGRMERPFRRTSLRAHRGRDQGPRAAGIDHRDQHLRRARRRHDQEADRQSQAVAAHAARAGRRARRRSAMSLRALCGRRGRRAAARARHCRPEHFGAPARHQMRAILAAADEICRAAGASLANLMRAHHFVGELAVVYPALRIWQEKLCRRAHPVRRGPHADGDPRLQYRGGHVGLLTRSSGFRSFGIGNRSTLLL